MPHSWLPKACVILRAAVETDLDMQGQTVAEDPPPFPAAMGVSRANVARRGIAQAFLWVKRDADNLAGSFLDQLWREDFLSQTAAHAEEYWDHAVKACTLRTVHEMMSLQVCFAGLRVLKAIRSLYVIDELSCGSR